MDTPNEEDYICDKCGCKGHITDRDDMSYEFECDSCGHTWGVWQLLGFDDD